MRRGWFVIMPAGLVGVIAAIVTISVHNADPTFVFDQQHPVRLQPGQLDRILMRTREPLATGQGSMAASVRCDPGTERPKLNPWRCTIRYASGQKITYRLRVQLTGRFHGADRTGSRVIEGCCLAGESMPSG